MYSVFIALSEYTYFYISKKHYYIHSCCLFLKSSKAFSVSIRRTTKSAWILPDKTEKWWQIMIERDISERFWTKNFE